MTLYEGRNRQIRRIFEDLGVSVRSLSRIAIASLSLGRLTEGAWRELTKKELNQLLSP